MKPMIEFGAQGHTTFMFSRENLVNRNVVWALIAQLKNRRDIVVYSDEEMSEKIPLPEVVDSALHVKTASLPWMKDVVKGYDFNKGIDYHQLLQSYRFCGFQATNFGMALEEINKMINCRNSPFPEDVNVDNDEDEFIRRKTNCTIFLGHTSNMSSCGVREVDVVVTTAGGVEEDLIKCLAPTFLGDFSLKGRDLRDKGINRIGNLLVPNDNYCQFEDWVMPILDELLEEQKDKGVIWSPSKIITRLGEKIDNPDSICYWAAKNKIPIFCPALTDGSLGDMIYFHTFKNPGFIVDIVQDIRRLNTMAVKATHSGIIIIGGGLVKHHVCNANLMRNGADFAVYLNAGQEYDGSDSGASPDEAVSWGKIRKDATPVKIFADATLIFPLLVGETFARFHHSQ